ncbi:GNAT family N-acetyltransferase [Streptomyces albidoflavus]|uniref:GNAT family N-acetyltransferase n=1 Tax=Streptomyces albidoflavus TaxID=1886 RepID=UPI0002493839|nr:GNAT family N-acetyltransferase [Streptomyces albidoflavus]MBV7647915.1 GNAT family N-acetyltransferase [Streptomyces albidoflavus]MBV7709374.1 GNAT family N-acetyltransferase [Streptomyces albidoflavus]RZD75451.1 GNAT family N-acetyltransferase [Streptomyces albidoflavus]RZE09791.1 GNAT family N-acetyltransferase [Streptomyces albidoflavus]
MSQPTPADVRVRVAEGPADREACFAVRKEVFVAEQGVDEAIEYDAFDAPESDTVHVLAEGPDGPLGTGRLLHGPAAAGATGGEPGVGSLGRLAVRQAARGLGVGAALVRGLEEAAAQLGLRAVDLHAQTHALGFYERLGYQAYGPEFEDAGIGHRAMRREL